MQLQIGNSSKYHQANQPAKEVFCSGGKVGNDHIIEKKTKCVQTVEVIIMMVSSEMVLINIKGEIFTMRSVKWTT